MKLFDFKDDEIYPPEKSMGGTNMKVIRCEYLEAASNYAVCLHRINAREKGSAPESVIGERCVRAIDNKSCPALAMKKEEAEAGRALYYVNRAKYLEQQTAFFNEKGWAAKVVTSKDYRPTKAKLSAFPPARQSAPEQPSASTQTSQKRHAEKREVEPASDAPSFADAINIALGEIEPNKSSPDIKPGMSLIEIARARMQQKGA